MKAKSAKDKGNRFENYLVERFREVDTKAMKTGGSGAGLDKNDIRVPQYDIEIEAKNANQVNLCKDFEQLERQTTGGNLGILAIRNPKKPEFQQTFIVLDLEDFLEMLKEKSNFEVEVQLDPNLKWKIKKLKDSAQEVFRELSK